jgi:hypothetical protein
LREEENPHSTCWQSYQSNGADPILIVTVCKRVHFVYSQICIGAAVRPRGYHALHA